MRQVQEVATPLLSRDTVLIREQRRERRFQLYIGHRRIFSFGTSAHIRSAETTAHATVYPKEVHGPFATVGRTAAITLVACATLAAVALTDFRADAQHPLLTIPLPEPTAAHARIVRRAEREALPGAGMRRSVPTPPALASPAVQTETDDDLHRALSAAFATGEFQEWSDAGRGVGGMVVVGTAEQTPDGSCRDVAIMTRGMSDSGHTESSRQCQDASGKIVRTNAD